MCLCLDHMNVALHSHGGAVSERAPNHPPSSVSNHDGGRLGRLVLLPFVWLVMRRTSPILQRTFLTKQSTYSNSAHTIVTALTRRGRSYIYMRSSVVVVFIVQSVRSSLTHFGGSFTYFTVMNCQFFIDCRVPTWKPLFLL